jgi:hypothetical protein
MNPVAGIPVKRERASAILAVVGALVALAGGFLLYARQEIFNPDHLANRAESALRDERFRLAVAQPIVDGILDEGPAKLVNARPVIESLVVGALGTSPARSAFGEGVKGVSSRLVNGDPDVLVLNLTDAAVIAVNTLDSVSPKVASGLPRQLDRVRTELLESDTAITPLTFAGKVRSLGIVLPALALLLLAGSVAIAGDRRRALQRVGVCIAGAAGFALAILLVARSLILAGFNDPLVHDAVAALWTALLHGLYVWVVAIGLGAVLLAAASRWGAEEVDPLAPLAATARLARRRPSGPALGVLRALAIALAGLALVVEPTLSLSVVAVAAGTWLIYVAVVEAMAILAPVIERPGTPELPRRRLRPAGLAAVTGVAVVVVAIVAISGGDDSSTARPPGPPPTCNGYAELCAKRLDEVTFPATHNSMSAAQYPGWFATNQRFGIRRQLDDGIRALLIDTHYGFRRSSGRGFGSVITDLKREEKTRGEVVAELGEPTVQRAEDLIGRLAFDGPPSGSSKPYLCHVLCELGATDLGRSLDGIDEWMRTHPDEFLVIFIEDVVSPGETYAALKRSGLMRYAYTPQPGVVGPTLGELIESDERLLVMAENDAGHGKYPGYVQGFDLVQETPFTFTSEEQIASPESCRPNRGSASNPLFLINNWIERIPRDPDLAGRIDSHRALLHRARLCERERGLEPNLLAVDFYDRGDVFGVSNVLNGLPADAEPSVRVLP